MGCVAVGKVAGRERGLQWWVGRVFIHLHSVQARQGVCCRAKHSESPYGTQSVQAHTRDERGEHA